MALTRMSSRVSPSSICPSTACMAASSRAKLSRISSMYARYSTGVPSGMAPPRKHRSTAVRLCSAPPESRAQKNTNRRMMGESTATSTHPTAFRLFSLVRMDAAALIANAGLMWHTSRRSRAGCPPGTPGGGPAVPRRTPESPARPSSGPAP